MVQADVYGTLRRKKIMNIPKKPTPEQHNQVMDTLKHIDELLSESAILVAEFYSMKYAAKLGKAALLVNSVRAKLSLDVQAEICAACDSGNDGGYECAISFDGTCARTRRTKTT